LIPVISACRDNTHTTERSIQLTINIRITCAEGRRGGEGKKQLVQDCREREREREREGEGERDGEREEE